MNKHYLQFFATSEEEKQKLGRSPTYAVVDSAPRAASPVYNAAADGTAVPKAAATPKAAAAPVFAGGPAANTSAGVNAPSYADTYGGQVNDLFTQITGRQPFNYDVNGDALYQQYKDKYIQQGKQAMRDTMGRAAALTGGYGSSYGQAVGQQQYDSYLQNLNDVIPELYGQAAAQYQREGDALQQQLQDASALQQNEYGRYQDALSQYNAEQQQAYNRQQDSYSKLAQLITTSGYTPNEDELTAAGMNADAANSLKQAWIVANPLLAYRNGDIDAEGYFGITGQYPAGYTPPNAGGGYYYDDDKPTKGYTLTKEDISQLVQEGYSVPQINQIVNGSDNKFSSQVTLKKYAEGYFY